VRRRTLVALLVAVTSLVLAASRGAAQARSMVLHFKSLP